MKLSIKFPRNSPKNIVVILVLKLEYFKMMAMMGICGTWYSTAATTTTTKKTEIIVNFPLKEIVIIDLWKSHVHTSFRPISCSYLINISLVWSIITEKIMCRGSHRGYDTLTLYVWYSYYHMEIVLLVRIILVLLMNYCRWIKFSIFHGKCTFKK